MIRIQRARPGVFHLSVGNTQVSLRETELVEIAEWAVADGLVEAQGLEDDHSEEPASIPYPTGSALVAYAILAAFVGAIVLAEIGALSLGGLIGVEIAGWLPFMFGWHMRDQARNQ